MMLRLAPVSPNKVVVVLPSSSSTRIPTFTAPRHLLVTKKAPILARPLKSEYEHVEAVKHSNRPDDFPFTIPLNMNVMTRELNREEIHVTITFEYPESGSVGGVFPPEGMLLAVKISKGNGMSATFDVKLWPHDMEVDSFTVKTLGMPELRIKMEEKEKLESAIQEHLKVRGIKPCYAEYLYRHMVCCKNVVYAC